MGVRFLLALQLQLHGHEHVVHLLPAVQNQNPESTCIHDAALEDAERKMIAFCNVKLVNETLTRKKGLPAAESDL